MMFRMTKGLDKSEKALALYSRCADESLCRAELILLAEEANKRFPGREVIGFYDVDQRITSQRMCRQYDERPGDKERLMELAKTVMQDWPYEVYEPDKVLS
jgi:hypothetical protein